jgi:acyl dehydratase
VPLDYHHLKRWPFGTFEHAYAERDSILYALALGFGEDPLDEAELRFVYEKDLLAVPTLAVVLGYPGFWLRDARSGVDWVRVLHGEQRLVLHAPLPAAGTVVGENRVARIVDKGPGKGALLVTERTVRDKRSGALLATVEQVTLCRGDGGYSAGGQPSDAPPPALPAVPQTPPELHCDLPTRRDAALLYRLCGDSNPLHAEPAVARAAGFERPILHGLATFGVAARALLRTCCGYDPSRLRSIAARFTAPVLPGDTLRVELWKDGQEVRFRVRARERIVLDHGAATLAA